MVHGHAPKIVIIIVLYKFVYISPPLLRRIPLAHGDGVVLQRLEVDHHAVRRADFVLAAVAFADVAVVVPHYSARVGFGKVRVHITGFFHQFWLIL